LLHIPKGQEAERRAEEKGENAAWSCARKDIERVPLTVPPSIISFFFFFFFFFSSPFSRLV